MTSKRTKIETVKEQLITDSVNVNKDRDLIFTSIELSKRSQVPVLFISGPGNGKTTCVNLYGKANGYYVETLIGSHYSQDEILGFQVNNEETKRLEIREPQWYQNIIDQYNIGVPSILFLDEISMASENVQGALLQVCFERKLRGNKKLPDNCIVVAAANYKENLPGFANIIAPELNRFCIINLNAGKDSSIKTNGFSLIDEALQGLQEVEDNLPTFREDFTISEDNVNLMVKDINNNFKKLFSMYSDKNDSSLGYLDIRNMTLDGIYDGVCDGVPDVYNFISKRTLSYYARMMKVICEMNIDPSNPVILKVIEGLVGLGTNNWNYEDESAVIEQLSKYHEVLYSQAIEIINAYSNEIAQQDTLSIEEAKNTFTEDSLAGKIQHFLWSNDISELDDITSVAYVTYQNDIKTLTDTMNNPLKFRSDIEAMKLLVYKLDSLVTDYPELKITRSTFQDVIKTFEFYYNTSIMSITSDALN